MLHELSGAELGGATAVFPEGNKHLYSYIVAECCESRLPASRAEETLGRQRKRQAKAAGRSVFGKQMTIGNFDSFSR